MPATVVVVETSSRDASAGRRFPGPDYAFSGGARACSRARAQSGAAATDEELARITRRPWPTFAGGELQRAVAVVDPRPDDGESLSRINRAPRRGGPDVLLDHLARAATKV